jgi:hypothetical protein
MPQALVVTGPAVLLFPTVGGMTAGPQEWALTQAQLDDWQEGFPNLDVLGECRKARIWILADLARRKTAKGMPKFLAAWLTRSVDRPQMRNVVPLRERPVDKGAQTVIEAQAALDELDAMRRYGR